MILVTHAQLRRCAVCEQQVTVGTMPGQGEPQTGSMAEGGERERKGESAPGAFQGAGQDEKVMSLSIRSAGPAAWAGSVCVFLNNNKKIASWNALEASRCSFVQFAWSNLTLKQE